MVTSPFVPKYANSFLFFWSINISFSTTNKGLSIIFIPRRNESRQKALSPILVTEEGISIDFNALQCQKALSPMLVTEDGIFIDSNELQFLKAK